MLVGASCRRIACASSSSSFCLRKIAMLVSRYQPRSCACRSISWRRTRSPSSRDFAESAGPGYWSCAERAAARKSPVVTTRPPTFASTSASREQPVSARAVTSASAERRRVRFSRIGEFLEFAAAPPDRRMPHAAGHARAGRAPSQPAEAALLRRSVRLGGEQILDVRLEQPRDAERERKTRVVLLGLDRVHGLARHAEALGQIALRPAVSRAALA